MTRLITDHLSKELSDAFYDVLGIRFNFVFSSENFTLPSDDLKTIMYSLLYDEESNKKFTAFVNNLAKSKLIIDSLDLLLVTILHEIGHIFTWYTFSVAELKEYHKAQRKLNKDYVNGRKDAMVDYFKLPVEIAATKFAVYWLKSHEAAHLVLRDRIKNAVNRFYIENNIEENDIETEFKED